MPFTRNVVQRYLIFRGTISRVKIYYATPNSQKLPAGHRFPMGKYELLRTRLEAELPACELRLSQPVTRGELSLVHDVPYIESVFQGTLSPSEQREIGFPWTIGMVERACGSSGATLMACRTAMQEGISANIAGGTHHAYANKGGGFCVFNDTAVAARVLQLEHQRKSVGPFGSSKPLKIGVIDLDVHQGNGTAHIFASDSSVFTLSMHGARNFPFKKEISDLDIELEDGCQDENYLNELDKALDIFEGRFKADLIIYLAGADPYEGDRLGRLNLSLEGLRMRDKKVFEWSYARGIPLAFSMAGGYAVPIEQTVEINMNTFKSAYSYWLKYSSNFHLNRLSMAK